MQVWEEGQHLLFEPINSLFESGGLCQESVFFQQILLSSPLYIIIHIGHIYVCMIGPELLFIGVEWLKYSPAITILKPSGLFVLFRIQEQ